MLLDQAFDRARFASVLRNDRPGVVHLASHAEFTGDADSSFVLPHDDRLSMEEVAALGLARMAIRAGARSAMGSLWWVSDEATSELVIDFYQALGTPGISKARALQQAQRVLLGSSEFHHPYYWAAFLLINNWL